MDVEENKNHTVNNPNPVVIESDKALQNKRQKFLQKLKSIWFWVSIPLSIYGVWVSTFAFAPKVELLYNSDILPPEQLALPIKIKNHSFWSLSYTSLTSKVAFEINDPATIGWNNYQFAPLPIINSNSTHDHTFEGYGITATPSSGQVDVTFKYTYSFLNLRYDITQTFKLVKNRNGEIRWQTIDTPDSAGPVILPDEYKDQIKKYGP